MSIEYYVVPSSGRPVKVSHDVYLESFSDPYLTLMTRENGVNVIEQFTKETEYEDFKSLGPNQ